MHRLKCAVQNYAWGKLGDSSEVAKLCEHEVKVDPQQPYAELWMGTHPKGPCNLVDGQLLSDWLSHNPKAMGSQLAAKCPQGQLPFLFKVLSVNKALSIQAHPTKEQAQKLHASDPGNYPDDNHKPEMAIALTPFELLCGFRPIAQIHTYIKAVPELFELVGGPAFQQLQKALDTDPNSCEAKAALRACFTQLMAQPEPIIQKNLASLCDRVALRMKLLDRSDEWYPLCELLIRLNYSFPGDIGCFAPFFLNHFVLQPSEACFLGPNEPHAYLYGDCIECMATSDNTIRAGLSPKFKDVSTLCDSLTYRMAGPEANKFKPEHQSEFLTVYDPPVPEFVVHKIEVQGSQELVVPKLSTCSILLVINGSATVSGGGQTLTRGQIHFVPADFELKLRSDSPWLAFRAFCDQRTIDQL